MATTSGGSFLDGFAQITRGLADAYGNVLVARANADAARYQMYGGHGGGFLETNANGDYETVNDPYGVDAGAISARLPTWAILVAVGGLVYLLARR